MVKKITYEASRDGTLDLDIVAPFHSFNHLGSTLVRVVGSGELP